MVNADIRQHHDVLPQKIVFPCQSIVRKVTQRVAEHRDQRPFQPQLQAECRATWRPTSIDFAPSSAIDRKPHWKTPPSQETSEPQVYGAAVRESNSTWPGTSVTAVNAISQILQQFHFTQ